jgi:hypothetical protein
MVASTTWKAAGLTCPWSASPADKQMKISKFFIASRNLDQYSERPGKIGKRSSVQKLTLIPVAPGTPDEL